MTRRLLLLPLVLVLCADLAQAGEERLVADRVRAWAEAWESGDIDQLMSFYSTGFQAGRLDLRRWRFKKLQGFRKSGPPTARPSNIGVSFDEDRAVAAFNLDYAVGSHEAYGEMTLVLRKEGKRWLVLSEDWRPLTTRAENPSLPPEPEPLLAETLTDDAEARSTPRPRPARRTATPAPPTAHEADAAERGHVVGVVDGDTIEVSLSGRVETVRLLGIDAPEMNAASPRERERAQRARDFVTEALLGRSVRLEADDLTSNRDKYGRLLRYAWVLREEDFNARLIREGLAEVYESFPFDRLTEYRSVGRQRPAAARTEVVMDERGGTTFYRTQKGRRYHRAGCTHLSKSRYVVSLRDAAAMGLGPCKVCRP